ncbi:carboxypeptidase-like regulatory domain-containing protein [Flavobacterium psychrotolerans]|uniref:TonB-dependent receptor n=1 Tax=Flavobacterium psychrotolerans TaxID=2169410 RepID=A0A2U1JNZ1_9FLAO|nr:carboxypeptidase-like regulatory domain-containing protein [Flavobacterium psychrotolerans]PWA06896.1 TonB-dependent receptor [Flavobacterium psychrotolerans]
MKKLVISTLFVMQVCFVFAQTVTGISGKVIDSKTQKPLQDVVASIQNTNLTQLTDVTGKFSFKDAIVGKQLLQIRTQGYKDQLLQIEVVSGKMLDLGVVVMQEDITQEQQTSLIAITESDLGDESNSSESTSSLLQSSRDTFLQAAAYNFGQARFSVRGIDNEYSNVMINGISMNRIGDGRPQYGDWGGLNDATRNQEFTNGSAASDYVFGGIAGTQEINTRASIYRPGTRLSFLNTNTNYSFRTMGTMASGMNKDGWAYVISAGRRWAQEGFYEGTNYSANSLFASVEKKFNEKHSLNFTSIYAQNKRGKNSPNTQEQTDLAGLKYNSYWGEQGGRRRNSRVKKTEEPLLMLTHYWKVNSKTNINTTASYQIGQIGNSRIDYTKSDNPDPTYYRKLPSYVLNEFSSAGVYLGNTPENIAEAGVLKEAFLANKQLDWSSMYRVNGENIANGSRFVLYEDRNDENIATVNSNLSSKLSDNIFMNAGVNYLNSRTKNFKNMLDLLGGDHFVDVSTFGITQDQQQADLNNPFRSVVVGNKFGYNYNIDATKLDAFTQFKFVYKKIDFYLAQTFSRSAYQREGLYKNGYYPTSSFGKSEKTIFDNFGFKGGATYKITGRQFIDFNGIYMSKAPNTKDVFANARLNNDITPNITNETIKSVDLSYIIKAPSFKARFTGYFSETLNSTDINFYYGDGLGGINAFVSEVVTGINKRNRGGEVGLEYQLTSTIKLTGVAAYGEYTFTNDPTVSVKDDAGLLNLQPQKAHLAGYKQSGMPQQAYSGGIEYRDPKFWWIGANYNYLSDNYIDVSTIRRTDNYYDPLNNPSITVDQTLANSYLKQEKFKAFALVNLVGGKSWKIAHKYTLGLFANINNVLDVTYKTGGFEQSRNSSYKQDYEDHQSGGASAFAPKYFYGYGRTYMANIYLTF